MRVAIVGAGIGGLAAGIALRLVGWEAVLLERAASLREVGAGLSIWSNAVNALRELGLEDRVLAAASVVDRTVTRTAAGRLIAEQDFTSIRKAANAPCICVQRGVLQKILLDSLPPASLRTGVRCSGFANSTALLENGERLDADVLVGADGISSVIREGLHGAEAPRYAGYTCWRGMCEENGVLPQASALLVLGRGSQFGLWPCGAGRLYWFLTKNAPPATTQSKAEALAVCRNWAPPVAEVVNATPAESILQNDLVDRTPLRWWGSGGVTLLGDAAHPATPNLGQGACQALEDAVVLADCLSTIQPVEAALHEYERRRIPRTSAIVRSSWQVGKLLQIESSVLRGLRDGLLGSSLGSRAGMRTLRNLLTYRVPRLPSARSLAP